MDRTVSPRSTGAYRAQAARPDRTRNPRRRSLVGWCGALLLRRPGAAVAVAAVLGCTGAVSWNALMRQPGHHPAPLFAGKTERAASEPARRAEASLAPLPVPRPAPITSAPVQDAPPQLQRAAATDPIAALIRSSDAANRSGDPPVDPHRVAAAQRALTKLGYGPLKPDGLIGATTRQALEHFEHDRSLPITGQLGARTSRQLAQQSGLEIE